jgi:hypothetical protein
MNQDNPSDAELETAIDIFIAFHELKAAVAETLKQNCHLADGDQCTLKLLKDAYAKANQGIGFDESEIPP